MLPAPVAPKVPARLGMDAAFSPYPAVVAGIAAPPKEAGIRLGTEAALIPPLAAAICGAVPVATPVVGTVAVLMGAAPPKNGLAMAVSTPAPPNPKAPDPNAPAPPIRPPVSILLRILPSPVKALYKPPTPAPIRAPPPIIAAVPVPRPMAVPTLKDIATNAILVPFL